MRFVKMLGRIMTRRLSSRQRRARQDASEARCDPGDRSGRVLLTGASLVLWRPRREWLVPIPTGAAAIAVPRSDEAPDRRPTGYFAGVSAPSRIWLSE
jgi:hypothetical protein